MGPGSNPDVSRADVRNLLDGADRSAEPITAAEAAEALGCSSSTAQSHLEALADRERVRSKRIDGGRRIWWREETRANGSTDQEAFRTFVDAVEEYAIFMLDPDGTVASWNDGAERIKGYSESEALGTHFSQFYTDDDVTANVPEQNLEAARAEGTVEDEGWRVRADGSRFWANVTITAIRDDEGTLRGFTKELAT